MKIAFWTTLVVLACDQALKWLVVIGLNLRHLGQIEVLPPWLTLTMAWNRGVNFGLFATDSPWLRLVLVLIALGVTAWVWIWVKRQGAPARMQLALGLLAGGALGNAIDRLTWGAVADFLNVSCCGFSNPWAFNLADIAIFVGAIGLIVTSGGKTHRDDTAGMG